MTTSQQTDRVSRPRGETDVAKVNREISSVSWERGWLDEDDVDAALAARKPVKEPEGHA